MTVFLTVLRTGDALVFQSLQSVAVTLRCRPWAPFAREKSCCLDPVEEHARKAIASSLPDPKFHLDSALRLYAMSTVARNNEFTYWLIYGPQIRALKFGVQSGTNCSR